MSDIPDDAPMPDELPPTPGGSAPPPEALAPSGRAADELPKTS